MTKFKVFFAATLSVLAISGCNYNDVKNQPAAASEKAKAGSPDAVVDFQTVKSQVFEPVCVKCHGPQLAKAGLRLDQYDSAFAHLAEIKSEVESGDMPPPPPRGSILSPEQKIMLLAWVDSGGPEKTVVTPPQPPPAQPPVVVTPPPSTPPVVPPQPPAPPTGPVVTPSFADVSKAVFVPQCIKCHSNTVAKGGVNLEQYTNAAAHAKEIGDALDIDDMPRKAPALAPDLKAIVYAWIEGGAPETVTAGVPPAKPPVVIPPKPHNDNDNNDDNNDNEHHGGHA